MVAPTAAPTDIKRYAPLTPRSKTSIVELRNELRHVRTRRSTSTVSEEATWVRTPRVRGSAPSLVVIEEENQRPSRVVTRKIERNARVPKRRNTLTYAPDLNSEDLKKALLALRTPGGSSSTNAAGRTQRRQRGDARSSTLSSIPCNSSAEMQLALQELRSKRSTLARADSTTTAESIRSQDLLLSVEDIQLGEAPEPSMCDSQETTEEPEVGLPAKKSLRDRLRGFFSKKQTDSERSGNSQDVEKITKYNSIYATLRALLTSHKTYNVQESEEKFGEVVHVSSP
ncbi:hypothetical protein L596_008862 [Steinernema carpocapsae]|uniref:Uncharacterized protein n=1 Tax=Steinernema carpocapsae TaxID=34508 RepID=A0A4U5PDQ4_STECR|nr:hypothetical protein L596_008862 [Steinernema carpocapsae]